MYVKILKALVYYMKTYVSCPGFFLFIKTFQAVKTFYLLMRESGKINDIELGSTTMSPLNHAQPASHRMEFNFCDRVQ